MSIFWTLRLRSLSVTPMHEKSPPPTRRSPPPPLKKEFSNPRPTAFVKMKWNESGFRPPLCTYRLNWARRTSWGWWDDWDDTVLQTQDSKFEPWRSEAEHATSRSRRLPTILTFTRGWGRNIFVSFQTAETGNRTPDSGVKGSDANHYPRAPAPQLLWAVDWWPAVDFRMARRVTRRRACSCFCCYHTI